MKKLLPYLYFAGAIFILVSAINRYNEDLDRYRIIFGFYVENKTTYLIIRIVIILLIIMMGITAFVKRKKES